MPESKMPVSSGTQSSDIAVLGGGSFGTAMAKVLGENGHRVHFWMRDQEQAEAIRTTGRNERYMPGIALQGDIQPTTDLASAIGNSNVVLVAIPSKAFRAVIREHSSEFRDGQIVVSLTKGIEEQGFKLMSEILQEEIPRCRSGVLSGPNLAAEIVNRDLTATVIAAKDPEVRRAVQEVLGCEYFRVYANVDIYGVELAGALKNIYAIVAGLASALDMGENAKAMLITRDGQRARSVRSRWVRASAAPPTRRRASPRTASW